MNEIHRDDLIPGELYFIECLTHTGNGEIIKTKHKNDGRVLSPL